MTMKKMNLYTLIGILVVLGSLLGACSANLERNPDGSLKLETTMQEGSLQDEIAIAIADPLMRDFSVELHAGYITVGAERGRAVGDKTDTVQFRLDLGVQDGHLTAVISDARLNDDPKRQQQPAGRRGNLRIAHHGLAHRDLAQPRVVKSSGVTCIEMSALQLP
jgi:hypothetical protein